MHYCALDEVILRVCRTFQVLAFYHGWLTSIKADIHTYIWSKTLRSFIEVDNIP